MQQSLKISQFLSCLWAAKVEHICTDTINIDIRLTDWYDCIVWIIHHRLTHARISPGISFHIIWYMRSSRLASVFSSWMRTRLFLWSVSARSLGAETETCQPSWIMTELSRCHTIHKCTTVFTRKMPCAGSSAWEQYMLDNKNHRWKQSTPRREFHSIAYRHIPLQCPLGPWSKLKDGDWGVYDHWHYSATQRWLCLHCSDYSHLLLKMGLWCFGCCLFPLNVRRHEPQRDCQTPLPLSTTAAFAGNMYICIFTQ